MNMRLIKGELGRLGVPDLFRAMAAESRSGRLTLSSDRGTQGVIYFRAGSIYEVRIEPRVSRLSRRLVSAGVATGEDLHEAKRTAGGSGGHLGEIVVGAGLLRRSRLEAIVREEFFDDVFDLVQWNQGTFVFDPEGTADVDLGVELNADELLTECERRLQEWRQIGRRIKSLTDVPILESAEQGPSDVTLTPEEWALVSRVDGQLSIRDLSDSCGFSTLEGARCAFGLLTSGLIGVRPGSDVDGETTTLGEMSLPESVSTPTEGTLVDVVLEAGGYVEGMEEQVDALENMAEMELEASAEPEVEPVELEPEPQADETESAVELQHEPAESEPPPVQEPEPEPAEPEPAEPEVVEPEVVEPEVVEPEVVEPEVVEPEALEPHPVEPEPVELPEPVAEHTTSSEADITTDPQLAESQPPVEEAASIIEEFEPEELPEVVADVELPPVPDTLPESFAEPAATDPEPIREPELEQEETEHTEIEAEPVKSVARITMPDPEQSGVYLEPAGSFFTSLWEGVNGDDAPEEKETFIVAEERPNSAEKPGAGSMSSVFADLARPLDEDLDIVSIQEAEPEATPSSEPRELYSYFGPRQVDPSVDTSALVREFSAMGREDEQATGSEPPTVKRGLDSKKFGRFGRRKPK